MARYGLWIHQDPGLSLSGSRYRGREDNHEPTKAAFPVIEKKLP